MHRKKEENTVTVRRIVREEIQRVLNESNGSQAAANAAINLRKQMNRLDRGMLGDLITQTERVDPGMVDWAESIREDFYDVMEEIRKLGNELSMK